MLSIEDDEDIQNRIVHYFLNIELIKFFKEKIGFQEHCLKLEINPFYCGDP